MAGQEGVQPEYLCDGKSVHRTDDSRIASVASDHAGEPRVDAIRDAASRCQVAAEVNEWFLELPMLLKVREHGALLPAQQNRDFFARPVRFSQVPKLVNNVGEHPLGEPSRHIDQHHSKGRWCDHR